jgi:y4mF family transcriptional regulator
MKDLIHRISQEVRSKRKALGLKLVEAAALCGVGVRFLSELENGKATLQWGKVIQVLEALGLTLEVRPRRRP